MPDRKTHTGIAALLAIIFAIILYKLSLSSYIGYGLTVFLGAILPDVIDPWSKENRFDHRKGGHRKILIKPLWIVAGVSLILAIFLPAFLLLMMFSLGYLSHLYADSVKTKTWSKGLPD